jgi:hypothetical protein
VAEDQTVVSTPAAYATAWEHLSNEFHRLDLLICCRLPGQPGGTPATPLQQFKGLVLTEEEIRGLLGNPFGPSSYDAEQNADDLTNQDVQAALTQVSSQIQARRTASLHRKPAAAASWPLKLMTGPEPIRRSRGC